MAFFRFKLCSRMQLEVLSEALLPGMYLPRDYIETLLIDSVTGTAWRQTDHVR